MPEDEEETPGHYMHPKSMERDFAQAMEFAHNQQVQQQIMEERWETVE